MTQYGMHTVDTKQNFHLCPIYMSPSPCRWLERTEVEPNYASTSQQLSAK